MLRRDIMNSAVKIMLNAEEKITRKEKKIPVALQNLEGHSSSSEILQQSVL